MVDVFDMGPLAPPEEVVSDEPLPPPPAMPSPVVSLQETAGATVAEAPGAGEDGEALHPAEAAAAAGEAGGHARASGSPDAAPATVVDPSAETEPSDPDIDAIIRFTTVAPKELKRAERIMTRLEDPRPIGEVLIELKLLTPGDLEEARRMRRAGMSLADILEEENHLSHEGRSKYDAAQELTPPPPDREILVEGGLVREEHYLRALSSKVGVAFVEPDIGAVDIDVYGRFEYGYLTGNLVLPVAEVAGSLHVIVATPDDEALIDDLERRFFMPVVHRCATATRILEALHTLERLRGQAADRQKFEVHYHVLDGADVSGEGETEAIQLVDYLLTRAIQMKASDLHVEPGLTRVRVRVRVDGVLHHLTDLPTDFASRVAERVKVLARLDPAECRRHQDGKIHVRADGRDADIRVSTYVSTFGEALVMRVIDRDKGVVPVDQIGFQPKAWRRLGDLVLKARSGLVLMAGPSGSGTTSTLYSFLDHANDPARKVITCEDPVESMIDGVIQCSVDARSGPTMAESLRSIVRHDPDTIGVGEIGDLETAQLAVDAALAGNKVYATFHTREAVGAFVRLMEMGVEPYLVGSTVTAVIAQRLVRRLCVHCRARHRASREELRFLGMTREDLGDRRFMGARECSACGGTGYHGRVAIHEVLIPDDDFKAAVMNRASQDDLRAIARSTPGFLTLMEDGVLKAAQGVTSLEEIIEHAPVDPHVRSLNEIELAMAEGRG